jgi:CheY-like chemotaxis protein
VNDPIAAVDPVRFVPVLAISRLEEDHANLDRTFRESESTLYPNCRLRLIRCSDSADAISILRGSPIPIVICDAGEQVEAWQQLARDLRGFSQPPCLILLSAVADDQLCASASKHGVYEVLAKPVRGPEVLRVINLAWRHWQDRYELPAGAPHHGKPSAGA